MGKLLLDQTKITEIPLENSATRVSGPYFAFSKRNDPVFDGCNLSLGAAAPLFFDFAPLCTEMLDGGRNAPQGTNKNITRQNISLIG